MTDGSARHVHRDADALTAREALRLVVHQTRYDLLVFRRNRQSTFFTLILPIIFLVIFASVFRSDTIRTAGGQEIKGSTYYVPQIVSLGIVSAAFSNVVGTVITQREMGVLKRRRATPLPAAVMVLARAISAVVIAVVLVIALLAVARFAYGVTIPGRAIGAIILTVLVGSVSLCCVAYAMTTLVNSSESAQPVIQAITLPIFFISGVFFPENIVPHWLLDVANIFPVRHLARALLSAFDPARTGSGIPTQHLLVLAAWGIGGAIVAIRRFTWTPRGGER